MVEKMKKIFMLIHSLNREYFLSKLQELGVVHIETETNEQNEEIVSIKEKIAKIDKVYKLLIDTFKKEKLPIQTEYYSEIESLVENIEKVYDEIENIKAEINNLNKEINILQPWGEFNPEILKKLKTYSIIFKFYVASKSQFKNLDLSNFIYSIISEKEGYIYFVVISDKQIDLQLEEIKLPDVGLKDLIEKREELHKKFERKISELKEFLKYKNFIEKSKGILEDKYDFLVGKSSFIEEARGHVLIMKGWVPISLLKKVKEFLEKEEVIYLIEEPKKTDTVPVLLKNDPITRLFEPLTKMHSLPQYFELDPTPFFAPFFSFFFGLCVGDAGYGILLFIAVLMTLLIARKKKLFPVLFFGLILSIFTIFSGYILDTFFGEKISNFTFLPEDFKKGIIFGNMQDQMAFALMLGIIQVCFGIFLQVINKIKQKGFLAGLQPLGTLFLLLSIIILGISSLKGTFKIGPIPIKEILTSIPGYFVLSIFLGIVGLFLILFFNNIDKKIYIRPLIGLWELYGLITGLPGDILSYIRLFALGLAGGLLGNAFNQIAFMLRDNVPIIGVFLMFLIMVLGHGINLALAALGAFVHPLRLVLLEFFKSLSFTGGGLPYSPFKNRVNNFK